MEGAKFWAHFAPGWAEEARVSRWMCGIALETHGAAVPASGLAKACRTLTAQRRPWEEKTRPRGHPGTEASVGTLISSNLKGHDRLHESALSALERRE